MKTNRLFLGIIGLLIIGELVSCVDHRIPTPGTNNLRVKTINREVPGLPTIISAFSYDDKGRLASITAYRLPDSANAPVELSLYQYDPQNRLTQVQHSVIRRGSGSETYTLSYNGAGQLIKLTNMPSTFSVTPQYGSDNQLTGFVKTINVTGRQGSGSGTVSFTGNNLTASTEIFTVNRLDLPGGPVSYQIYQRSTFIPTQYTVDNLLNPFYGTYIIPAPGVFLPAAGLDMYEPFYTLYGGIDNLFNLSQNNVTSTRYNGVPTGYIYTYNAANLPASRTTYGPGFSVRPVIEILTYEYEPY